MNSIAISDGPSPYTLYDIGMYYIDILSTLIDFSLVQPSIYSYMFHLWVTQTHSKLIRPQMGAILRIVKKSKS